MQRIGRGRCADVYAISDDLVLKLYEKRFSRTWVDGAAELASAVHRAGIPSVEVHAVETRGDRHGMVLERIDGCTLWDAIADQPEAAEIWGERLADLHLAVQQCTIPSLPERLPYLAERVALHSDVEAVAIAVAHIESGPHDSVLSHGDLHPANVMVTANGELRSIDWDGAMLGPRAYDAARTHYLVESWALAPGTTTAVEPVREEVAAAFTSRYAELAPSVELDDWRLPVILARYAEGVTEEIPLLDAQRAALDR
ncbi:MAG: aminoglycoside phosphotransferase family protein [Acidimicrobiales bacterium]